MCAEGELLLGHATGSSRFDIPKGIADPGESHVEAALREMHEEFGLRLQDCIPAALGVFPYRTGKDLALFAALITRVDPARLWCSSTFIDRFHRERTEMDGYRWASFDRIPGLCAPAMAKVLLESRLLATTFNALMADGRCAEPIVSLRPIRE